MDAPSKIPRHDVESISLATCGPLPHGVFNFIPSLLLTELFSSLQVRRRVTPVCRLSGRLASPTTATPSSRWLPKGTPNSRTTVSSSLGNPTPGRTGPTFTPGPLDGWSGARPHTFTVIFGVASTPREGDAKLEFDLLDTQSKTPPELRVQVNGESFSLEDSERSGRRIDLWSTRHGP